MKTYGGVNVKIHVSLLSAQVGDEWSAVYAVYIRQITKKVAARSRCY
jgi:hypothetical protein